MADKEQKPQSDFMIEKIKKRPLNKGKLLRKTILTVSMAVIFGLVASLTFLVLVPAITNWLYPQVPETPQTVVFPEDSEEEMLPEDMLAENQPTEAPTPEETEEPVVLEEEQIEAILSGVVLDKENYKELYATMSDFVMELNQYMVTVTAMTSSIDWFNNVEERQNQTSGCIIADNGLELLIMAEATSLRSAESLIVTFYNNVQVEAQIKRIDAYTNIAVLAIDFDSLPEDMQAENMKYPYLGSSNKRNMLGMPVVALGSPMGISNSVGYGMITASNSAYSVPDRNFKIIHTDIIGSSNANGVLFNLDGDLIGIITSNKFTYDMKNVIYAYGVTEMRKTLEKLSNDAGFAYLGITGLNVSSEASRVYGVPLGAFVKKVDMDSPAMKAGIQPGDVIIGVNDRSINTFTEYTSLLMQMNPGDEIELQVARQSQDGYKEMNFTMETGEAMK